jgi:hypothetical protein
MLQYSKTVRDKAKKAINIVDVIKGFIDLEYKHHSRYMGLSPFTKEKTPSMMVNEESQTFFCHQSEVGGDVFDFIEKMDELGVGTVTKSQLVATLIRDSGDSVKDHLACDSAMLAYINDDRVTAAFDSVGRNW